MDWNEHELVQGFAGQPAQVLPFPRNNFPVRRISRLYFTCWEVSFLNERANIHIIESVRSTVDQELSSRARKVVCRYDTGRKKRLLLYRSCPLPYPTHFVVWINANWYLKKASTTYIRIWLRLQTQVPIYRQCRCSYLGRCRHQTISKHECIDFLVPKRLCATLYFYQQHTQITVQRL